jgi:hypothetical protein
MPIALGTRAAVEFGVEAANSILVAKASSALTPVAGPADDQGRKTVGGAAAGVAARIRALLNGLERNVPDPARQAGHP